MTALSETIAVEGDLLEAVLSVNLDDPIRRIEVSRRVWFVGTGTSQHAAELGAWMFAAGDKEVRWSSSSAFALDESALGADDAVVVISHTAETAFARRARLRALNAGANIVSITGEGRGWSEAVETVPPERSLAWTPTLGVAANTTLGRSAEGQPEPAALPPGDGDVGFGESGVEHVGVVGAFAEAACSWPWVAALPSWRSSAPMEALPVRAQIGSARRRTSLSA
jgi:SIS domain